MTTRGPENLQRPAPKAVFGVPLRRKFTHGELALLALAASFMLAGCSHHTNVAQSQPAPPVIERAPQTVPESGAANATEAEGPREKHYVEVGMASWYGPNYHHHRAANGDVYDQDGITAAHRTLPLGSVVRVTNLKNGVQVTLKITDRGPFVPDRMLDLSIGAAKALQIWPHGTSQVRVELISSPPAKVPGGRWCVQIGVFKDADNAEELKAKLQRKYSGAEVLEFAGPTGHWVRIRPPHDDRKQAFQIAEGLRPVEGNAYLVRLD
jgi:rare lipoprotein A